MTPYFDTLLSEMRELAEDMTAKGVPVTYREFAGVDHGFTHAKPADVAGQALRMIAEHLRKAYRLVSQEEQNVAVVKRFIDGAINRGNLDVVDETWAEDMTWDGGSLGSYKSRDAYKAFFAANSTGSFADMYLDVQDVVAQGDKVVVRFTNSGTNVGEFMGVAATGKRVTWLGIGIYTVM